MKKDNLILGKFTPLEVGLPFIFLLIGLILGMFLKSTLVDKKYTCACFDEKKEIIHASKVSINKEIPYKLNGKDILISLTFNYDGNKNITLNIDDYIKEEIIYTNERMVTDEDIFTIINNEYTKISKSTKTFKDNMTKKEYLLLTYDTIDKGYLLLIDDNNKLINKEISNDNKLNVKILSKEELPNRTYVENNDNNYKYIYYNDNNIIETHEYSYYYLDLNEICNNKITEYKIELTNGQIVKSITNIYDNKENKFLIKSNKDEVCK